MASFKAWMLPSKRRWRRIIAGYQELYNDKGNWSTGQIGVGQLIGTNRSISAPKLIDWRQRKGGQPVTKAAMMQLSIHEAVQIYKEDIWDKVKGDSINSQAIADLLADMKSSAGGNAIKEMQKVLNLFGEQLAIDGAFGPASLAALNRQIKRVGVAPIFNRFRGHMIAYYQRISSPYKKQLIGSLNEDYPPMEENAILRNAPIIALGAFVVLSGGYALYQFNKARA